MTIRILADREPYSSYLHSLPPDDAGCGRQLVVLGGPMRVDDPVPDLVVLPVEDYLALPRVLGAADHGMAYLPYGSIDLMAPAFERGCADYLRVPWSLTELLARAGRLATMKFRHSGRLFELRGSTLACGERSVGLSERERLLLGLFLKNAPLPVSRDAAGSLLAKAGLGEFRVLGPSVASLRGKLEGLEPGSSAGLRTVRDFGYKLEVDTCG